MNILAIGDVVGTGGCSFLRENLNKIKEQYKIDLTIANGENSAENNGINLASAKYLLQSGVDVVTSGNHAFQRMESKEVYENNKTIIRPANYPEKTTPGSGYCYIKCNNLEVLVINVLGTTFLEALKNPFETVDDILNLNNNRTKIIVLDLHAEATAEKIAMGFYLDGRVSAIFGTHTHVQTADDRVLPKGTGYITDVGMTGAINSVLGIEPEVIIKRCITHLPEKFVRAKGPHKMECIIFKIDENTGITVKTKRLVVT